MDLGTLSVLAWLLPTGSALLLLLYNTVGLVLANTNSYVWNTRWSFRNRGRPGRRQKLWFALQALLNVCLGNAVLWGAASFLIAHTTLSVFAGENVAKVLSALVASTVSFLIMKRFVFREQQEKALSSGSTTVVHKD